MRGIELCKQYFEEVAKPVFQKEFPDALSVMAVGLAGEGSDCFGFDDEISRDHDWGPGFCIWLTAKDDQRYGNRISRIYQGLPGELPGYPRRSVTPDGAGRVGVMRISDFYEQFTGSPDGPHTLMEWLALPEQYLATAVNGSVFQDPVGTFTAVRKRLQGFYPEDVRRKKIAARAGKMGQSGQYNYQRCLRHGEPVAAQLALHEFLTTGISMVYLLNKKYTPFYKWSHRGMDDLDILRETKDLFAKLCSDMDMQEKQKLIEEISAMVVQELKRQDLISGRSDFLLDCGAEIMDHIRDPQLRSLHFLVG